MELLVATGIGVMTASGIYLILRLRAFPVILGLALLTYAVNLFLFTSGRLTVDLPAVLNEAAQGYADPLPQALVLTAIVISFGMTAVVVLLALGAYIEAGDDNIERSGPPDPKVRPGHDTSSVDPALSGETEPAKVSQ